MKNSKTNSSRLDAKNGNLSVSGWKENLNVKTIDYLMDVKDFISRISIQILIEMERENSLTFKRQLKSQISNCPVVISGGVSSIKDIKKAKELNNKKIEGIIVGKAIYDGDIKLEELARRLMLKKNYTLFRRTKR